MTRHFLRGDPDRITAFLVEGARADHPPSGARERAVVRVLAGVTSGGAALVGTAAASAGKLTPVASSLVSWALGGVALGVLSTGLIGGGVHWLGHRTAAPSAGPAISAATTQPGSPFSRSIPVPPAAREETTESEHPENARSAETAEPTPAPRPGETSEAIPSAQRPPAGGPAVADFSEAPLRSTQLQRELALLDEVRTNLASKRLPFAEQALVRYEREFSGGAMQVEAMALRVELLVALGRNDEARVLGGAFLARYPTSPSAARIRSFVNLHAESEKR